MNRCQFATYPAADRACRAQAILELGEHLSGLDEPERERVIEEVARAVHRRAWPLLSAGKIWDSLIG